MAEEVAKTIDTAQEITHTGQEPEVKQAQGAFSKVKRELSNADLKKTRSGKIVARSK